jgi:hypothetical protein
VTRSRPLAAVAACLLAVLPLAGCYQGFDGTVSTQSPSGNGTDFQVGDIKVQDATLVTDPADPTRASLIMTILNEGEADDALASASVGEVEGAVTGPTALPSGAVLPVGLPGATTSVLVDGLAAKPGDFALLTMSFQAAGSTGEPIDVKVVVGEDYYAEFAPPAASPAP